MFIVVKNEDLNLFGCNVVHCDSDKNRDVLPGSDLKAQNVPLLCSAPALTPYLIRNKDLKLHGKATIWSFVVIFKGSLI